MFVLRFSMRVHVCVRVCVCLRVYECVCVCVCVRALARRCNVISFIGLFTTSNLRPLLLVTSVIRSGAY